MKPSQWKIQSLPSNHSPFLTPIRKIRLLPQICSHQTTLPRKRHRLRKLQSHDANGSPLRTSFFCLGGRTCRPSRNRHLGIIRKTLSPNLRHRRNCRRPPFPSVYRHKPPRRKLTHSNPLAIFQRIYDKSNSLIRQ